MALSESETARLSDAAAIYRHEGNIDAALRLEAVVSRLDFGRPVRVVDLDAAEELALAVLPATWTNREAGS